MYSLKTSVTPQLEHRDRLLVAFRLILAIPHAILVGPIVGWSRSGSAGLLAAAAYFLAIVNWFALVFANKDISTIRDFALFYLRRRTRAVAYMALFVDQYPPFGDGPYPASVQVDPPPVDRDRLSIALRLLLIIPHALVLSVLLLAWFVTTVIAWFSILFSGKYPPSLYPFGLGVMGWLLRVEAYLLLLTDEYPPFTLKELP